MCPDIREIVVIKNKMVIERLQMAVKVIGPESLGIPIKRVGTHSIRTSFTTLLHINGAADSLIMKMGRWKSNAFLRYIRGYVSSFGDDVATLLTNDKKGDFTLLLN